jgi:hypothetical protein
MTSFYMIQSKKKEIEKPNPPGVRAVTLSVGTPLCPYGIAYRRVHGWSTSKNEIEKPNPPGVRAHSKRGSGFGVQGSAFVVPGLGCGAQGLGFGVQGLGLMVHTLRCICSCSYY